MKALLTSSAAALTLVGAALLSTVPAQAQVNFEFGARGMRAYDDGPRVERRIVERRAPARRVIREIEDDEGEVCETRTRRMMVNGVMRSRRVTVCE